MADFWHLHELDWMSGLTEEDTEQLRLASMVHEFAPGEVVFAPSSTPHSVYLLERGRVRIYRLSASGSETTFGYVAPGEVFGELSALGSYPRESFAEAAESSTVWKLPAAGFQRLLAERPGVALAIGRQVGSRFKSVESRVENLVFRNVKARVAGILLELAERFGRPDGGQTLIDFPITQAELATLVGATRQSVNESLSAFREEGWIGRRGRKTTVIDAASLREKSLDGLSRAKPDAAD